jgi:hypothetical protein
VADRFERHFGKTKDELIEYFGTLHLARLNQDGTYPIFSVDDHGVIKAHYQKLKAGTKVFADANGMPILKASCGNALVSGSTLQLPPVHASVGVFNDRPRDLVVTSPIASEIQPVALLAEPPGAPVAVMPVLPDQVVTGTNNQNFAVPALLAALSGAGGIMIGGGGHPSPVPEPSGILVIVGAVGAMILRRKRS